MRSTKCCVFQFLPAEAVGILHYASGNVFEVGTPPMAHELFSPSGTTKHDVHVRGPAHASLEIRKCDNSDRWANFGRLI